MINLILVSKQASVCRSLREFLHTDPELEILAEVASSDEALEKVDLLSPNILQNVFNGNQLNFSSRRYEFG